MSRKRSSARRALGLAVGLAAGLIAATAPAPSSADGEDGAASAPERVLREGAGGVAFVDNAACQSCHAEVFERWRRSDHAHAMTPTTPESVLGDFDDAVFEDAGARARFFRRDGRYFVETEGPDGETGVFEALYTFGYRPLQQVLLALPGGRLQAFSIAWDTERKRWFRILDDAPPPGDPLHWTGRFQNWNAGCAECHSTDLRKGYDAEARRFHTTFAEPNVGCQACHGPGAAHVAWTMAPDAADATRGLAVDVAAPGFDVAVEVCARCHARRFRLTVDDRHDAAFLDQFSPATLREGLYHADGQIDDEVFVYGSFMQSKMRRAGVTCGDCHDPHDGALHAEGNALCAACHNETPPGRFATITPMRYDDPAHHHHPADSDGALCVSCHMPTKTYMRVDPRRDHSFRAPRPDLSAETGAPNACRNCHADRGDAWAAAQIDAWAGPGWRARPSVGPAFAAARQGDPDAVPALAAILADEAASGLVRATAAELLGDYGATAAAPLLGALGDADPVARAAAVEALAGLRSPEAVAWFGALLDDPSRAVRMNAARALASLPRELVPEDRRPALDAGIAAFIEAQRAAAETPEAQLNLARLYGELGRTAEARAAFETAIAIAPDHAPAYFQYSTLLSAAGDSAGAERLLRGAVSRLPGFADGYYGLGLLLAEKRDLDQAEAMLAKAAEIDPSHASALYALGVVRMRLKRHEAAEAALEQAYAAEPASPQALQALVISLLQRGALEKAEARAEALVAAFPDAPEARQLLEQVRRFRARP